MFQIEVANEQTAHPLDAARLAAAARAVLAGEGIARASVSVAVVDDPTIHVLNRQHLDHDYPTDVLSFLLESGGDGAGERILEGEVIVSADTAARVAAQGGWTAEDELLLYVVHGVLHLTGLDDYDPADRRQMRTREQRYLAELGVTGPAAVDE